MTKPNRSTDIEAFLASKRASNPSYGKCPPGKAEAVSLYRLRRREEDALAAENQAERAAESAAEFQLTQGRAASGFSTDGSAE